MGQTIKPLKKQTLHDVKPGTKLVWAMGYGSSTVLFEAQVIMKTKTHVKVLYRYHSYGPSLGGIEYLTKSEVSSAIKHGMAYVGVETTEKTEDGITRKFIKPRPLTETEEEQAKKEREAWIQFTKSETYMSM